jgi:hypothetical protein
MDTPLPSNTETWLEGVWTFYFHDPDDNNWTLESYKRLGDVSSVEEMWTVLKATTKYSQTGMFFVMREHVFPCWDDANNIDGGCLSIKVPIDAVPSTWEYLVKRTLGETLVVDPKKWESLNGISVSPKRGFCIFKLWMSDTGGGDPETSGSSQREAPLGGWTRSSLLLPPDYRGDVVFRLNRENMQMDSIKMQEKQGGIKAQ